jgi:hypothetical protein
LLHSIPEKIKESIQRDSKIMAELKKIPKVFAERLKYKIIDKGIDIFLDTALKSGGSVVAAFYIAKYLSG